MTYRIATLLAAGLLTASAALAAEGGDARPQLVPGGIDLAQGVKRVQLMSGSGISLGTFSPLAAALPVALPRMVTPAGQDKLAAGGFVAFSQDNYTLASTYANREDGSKTRFSASYANDWLGLPGTASLSLGYDRRRANNLVPSSFTTQPLTPSGPLLTLSWDHAISPNLYFGGYASAQRITPLAEDPLLQASNVYHLGAGLGLKF